MARLPKGFKPLRKPAEPRRARSGYFLWCDDARRAGGDDPELAGKSMAVASKVLAARWAALPADEKKPYEDRSAALKEEFKARKAEAAPAKPALPSGWKLVRDACSGTAAYVNIVTGRAQWARPGDADAVDVPPPPPSARRLFEAEKRAEGCTLNLKALAALWKDVPLERRAEYEAKAKAAREARSGAEPAASGAEQGAKPAGEL
jgi:hypothetical protein